jgi:hypothetical protein
MFRLAAFASLPPSGYQSANQADLEREASVSSGIAVPAPAPGRVTEQGIDAGGGAGLARRLVPRKGGLRVESVAGSRER